MTFIFKPLLASKQDLGFSGTADFQRYLFQLLAFTIIFIDENTSLEVTQVHLSQPPTS